MGTGYAVSGSGVGCGGWALPHFSTGVVLLHLVIVVFQVGGGGLDEEQLPVLQVGHIQAGQTGTLDELKVVRAGHALVLAARPHFFLLSIALAIHLIRSSVGSIVDRGGGGSSFIHISIQIGSINHIGGSICSVIHWCCSVSCCCSSI